MPEIDIKLMDLDRIMSIQKNAIQIRILYSIALLTTGIVLFLIVNLSDFFGEGETLKTALSLASLLIASIISFPIKEILDKTGSLKICNALKDRIHHLKLIDGPEDELEYSFGLIEEIMKKLALS